MNTMSSFSIFAHINLYPYSQRKLVNIYQSSKKFTIKEIPIAVIIPEWEPI